MSKTFTGSELRQALGSFATGITVVTTLGTGRQPVGITVNSFNSVSLEPPLVLWSLDRHTNCFDDFVQAQSFAVHILASDQQALSERFATVRTDRFADIQYSTGLSGIPILPHYSACFQCTMEHQYEGGDHIILVGRVTEFTDNQLPPLLYYRGQYKTL